MKEEKQHEKKRLIATMEIYTTSKEGRPTPVPCLRRSFQCIFFGLPQKYYYCDYYYRYTTSFIIYTSYNKRIHLQHSIRIVVVVVVVVEKEVNIERVVFFIEMLVRVERERERERGGAKGRWKCFCRYIKCLDFLLFISAFRLVRQKEKPPLPSPTSL